jgi:hypothetical protein
MMAQTYAARRTLSLQEKLNDEYCSGLFKTTDGTIIDIAGENSAKAYFNILEWLQGRVAGLQIYHKKDGTPVPFIRNSKANIYIDEIPVDPGELNTVAISDMAIIKIIKGPFAGGFGNGAGVIAIYTLKGDDDSSDSAIADVVMTGGK